MSDNKEKDPSDNIWSRIIGYILMFMFLTTPKDKKESTPNKEQDSK